MSVPSGPQFQFSFGMYDVIDPIVNLPADQKEALLTTRDRELEDYLSMLHDSGNFWKIDSTPSLAVDEATTGGAQSVYIDPTNAGNALVYIVNDTTTATVTVFAAGEVDVNSLGRTAITGANSIALTSASGSVQATAGTSMTLAAAGGDLLIQATGSGKNATVTVNNGGSIQFVVSGGGYITMSGLPTVNPGGTGRIWNNGGVLNIT
jgi:hypothetical protein